MEEKRPANGFCDLFVNWAPRFLKFRLLLFWYMGFTKDYCTKMTWE